MNNQIVTVTQIMKDFKVGRKRAKKIFEVTKGIDNDPFNLRPTQVPIKLVKKVLNI